MFVWDLLHGCSTDFDEIAQGGPLGVRERPREINFWKKSNSVAMVMKKTSKSSHFDLMVMIFCIWCLLEHINLPAKNEQNPPSFFGDRPIATAWQPESEWDPGSIAHFCDVPRRCDVTPSFTWRHDVAVTSWRHRSDLSFQGLSDWW